MKRTVLLPDERATVALAGQLARALPGNPGGWLILLQGELGSGKSTLARAMLRAMGHDGIVPSPTYTLVEPYNIRDFTVYHVDLYRLSSPQELDFLGWADLDEGLRLIEWPERAEGLAEQADLRIELDYNGQGRRASITAPSSRGRRMLAGMNLN